MKAKKGICHELLPVCLGFFSALANVGCSSASYGAKTPGMLGINTVNPLIAKLEDVALTQESRLAGFIQPDNRLVIVNVGTGEEIWWRSDLDPAAQFIPYNIRDGVILRLQNTLELFLLNGGKASVTVQNSHLLGRGSNETQFVASYEKKSEIVNLLDTNSATRQVSLPHDDSLFAKDSQGAEMPYKDAIHSFFASPTNDVVISLDLLLLKFALFNSTGISSVGGTQFSAQQFKLCSAGNLNTVSDLLLSRTSSTSRSLPDSKAVFDPERLPVSYAIDAGYKGVLLMTRDGRLIHLDFATACAGGNAIQVLNTSSPSGSSVQSKGTLIPLQASTFALQTPENKLDIYTVSQSGIAKKGTVENVCKDPILAHRVYDNRLLLACGISSSNGLAVASLTSIQLIQLDAVNVVASASPTDSSGIAGMAFDNTHPKLYVLSNRSLGQLTTFDFSENTSKLDVKTNFSLKNILDKL